MDFIRYRLLPFILAFALVGSCALSFAPSRASAAPVLSVGEALTVAEILDELEDMGIDIGSIPLGISNPQQLLLLTASGIWDNFGDERSDVGRIVGKLFDINNALFWNTSHTGIVQKQNNNYVPVDSSSDLWFATPGFTGGSLIPYNYALVSEGHSATASSGTVFECYTWWAELTLTTPVKDVVVLPIFNNAAYTGVGSNYYLLHCSSAPTTIQGYKLLDSSPFSSVFEVSPYAFPNFNTSNLDSYRVGVSFASPWLWCSRDNRQPPWHMPDGTPVPGSTNNYSPTGGQLKWLNPSDGSEITSPSGDIDWLVYFTDPLVIPPDAPGDNYITIDPDNPTFGGSSIFSPDGAFGNLLDWLSNGFNFTGSIDVTGDYNLTLGGSLTLNQNHNLGGSVTININDSIDPLWATPGSATDFGHDVVISGDGYNNFLSWMITSVQSVPALLSPVLAILPPYVLYVISGGIAFMVLVGVWRTFRGG